MIGDLNRAEMERVLRTEAVGHLACCPDGRPYVVPIAYAYHEGCIYAHSGLGMKVEAMREQPEVCFQVEHIDNVAEWKSVIAWGRYEELDGEEADNALHLLVGRLSPLLPDSDAENKDLESDGLSGSTRHILSRSSRHGVVYRIRVTEMTGRFERR
jgi:nitroimidazol reductase NimA-like FMN-containing flavoprotein (pyridoxamine 5'-phosphate oxidase superfamily)